MHDEEYKLPHKYFELRDFLENMQKQLNPWMVGLENAGWKTGKDGNSYEFLDDREQSAAEILYNMFRHLDDDIYSILWMIGYHADIDLTEILKKIWPEEEKDNV